MTDVHVPKMGMSTVEVDVLRLLVAVGDRVAAGDVVAEIEAEKAQLDVEAGAAGVVTELLVAEGDVREVGDVLLRIDENA